MVFIEMRYGRNKAPNIYDESAASSSIKEYYN